MRPTSSAGKDQATVLLRGKTSWVGWGLAAWGGVLYDEPWP